MSSTEVNDNNNNNNDDPNSDHIDIITLDDPSLPQSSDSNKNDDLANSLKHSSEKGGYISSIFNITNTIIGGGILALPYGIKQAGLLLGIFFIIIQAFIVVFSSSLLTKSSKIIKPNSVSSYKEISKYAFGKAGPFIVSITLLVFLFGTLTGYIVIIGNTIKPFIYQLNWKVDYRLFSGLIAFCIIMPISNLKHMNSLRYVSYFSLVCIVFLILSVMVKSIIYFTNNQIGNIRYFRFEMSFFSSVPIITFAYTFHTNIFPIWSELRDTSRRMISRSVIVSAAICCISYLLMGIFGYLRFLDDTTDNILSNFEKDILMDIVKIDYLIIVLFSYPMMSLPFRKVFSSLIFNSPERWWRRAIIVLWLIGLTYILAISIPSISFVFGIIGTTAGQLIISIYPSLFYIILEGNYNNNELPTSKDDDDNDQSRSNIPLNNENSIKKTWIKKYFTLRKLPSYILLIYGVVFGVIGVVEILLHPPK